MLETDRQGKHFPTRLEAGACPQIGGQAPTMQNIATKPCAKKIKQMAVRFDSVTAKIMGKQ
jgi:hypothetical protein